MAPISKWTMWLLASQITSLPGRARRWRAIWLPIVPEGTKSAAAVPIAAAASSCSVRTVGASPKTSSPTSASAIARRISASGRVTVSDRRSMRSVVMIASGSEAEPHPHRSLHHLAPLHLDGDLGEEEVQGEAGIGDAAVAAVGELGGAAAEPAAAVDDADPDVGGEDREALGEEELGAVLAQVVGTGVQRAAAGQADRQRRRHQASRGDGVLELGREQPHVAA